MMGAVDYIFGGMNAVFYKTDFVLNTSDYSSDEAYISAARQSGGRGYLMYECHVVSPILEKKPLLVMVLSQVILDVLGVQTQVK